MKTASLEKCASEGEECACAYGNFIVYGAEDSEGGLDLTSDNTYVTSQG